jgi:hypothetical protein
MEGDKIAMTMNGKGTTFESMVNAFVSAGLTAKEVTAFEYKLEEKRQEEMMLDRDETLKF